MRLKVGDRVYNHGDMANMPHFGTVSAVKEPGKWGGLQYQIEPDDDSDRDDRYWIFGTMVHAEFKGHSGTRIVPASAYFEYRAKRLREYQTARGV